MVGAAILRGGRCLVAQRGNGMTEPGRWEFPGGKIEPGESPQAALVREVEEELGCAIRVGPRLGTGRAETPRARVRLDVFEASLVAGEPRAREHRALRWAVPDALEHLDWAPADVPVAPRVATRLRGSDAPRPEREESDGEAADEAEIEDGQGIEEVGHRGVSRG